MVEIDNQMKPKVFVGIHEIGNTIQVWSDALEGLGFEVRSVAVDPTNRSIHSQSGRGYDEIIPKFENSKVKYAFNIVKEFILSLIICDIFIFTASGSFFASLAYIKFTRALKCHCEWV
jgi:hypothetical protein